MLWGYAPRCEVLRSLFPVLLGCAVMWGSCVRLPTLPKVLTNTTGITQFLDLTLQMFLLSLDVCVPTHCGADIYSCT